MATWPDVLIRKLQEHSRLSPQDVMAIRRLPCTRVAFDAYQDIVRQGDAPTVSACVLEGMLARYHTRPGGGRQYLSLHIAGDMPDAQALFLETMDHALCALNDASVGLVPHTALLAMFEERPNAAFAFWRETLIDAAIFREAITNNSARPIQARLAHFLCEQFYRARRTGLVKSGSCSFPLTQTEIGEAIGASLPSVSRALRGLRDTGLVELGGGRLQVRNWTRLAELGDFNPGYLHLRKP